jgi:sugar O-acyltransferase (sialic acid O-acetyltransferase NeuD family)
LRNTLETYNQTKSTGRLNPVEYDKIALLGAGGQARETREYANRCGLEVSFWTAHGNYRPQDSATKFVALEDLSIEDHAIPAICCVGAPGLKCELIETIKSDRYISVIAPNAYIAQDATIGVGVTVAPQVSITSGAKIGSHVLINAGATISHDVNIGDFSTIGPGVHIGGNATIGKGVVIGIGAVIKQGVKIGDHTYIGANSLVLNDLENYVLAYGTPAKVQSKRQGWIDEL